MHIAIGSWRLSIAIRTWRMRSSGWRLSTAIRTWRMRSSGAHCDPELAKRGGETLIVTWLRGLARPLARRRGAGEEEAEEENKEKKKKEK